MKNLLTLISIIFFFSCDNSTEPIFVDDYSNNNNQSILLAILSEVKFTDSGKTKIVLNDYLNIAKSFITQSEVNIINAILDKIINEKK